MKKITAFEIIDHGAEHSQYFQGCGTSFTEFDLAFTGAGIDAKEAYNDALEQVHMADLDGNKLPKRPRGINAKNRVPAEALADEYNEVYYYVSIRVKTV